jgi:hypothetical protein
LAAGDSADVTVHFHVATTTDSATAVSNDAAAATDDNGGQTATANDTVNIVEDVQLSVTKAFDSGTVTAGGDAAKFTIDVKNDGDLRRRQPRPDRRGPGRL